MARKLEEGEPAGQSSLDTGTKTDSRGPLLGRRKYVKLGLAAAAGTAGIASTSGTVSASAEREGIEFEQVLDAVEDLQMDPTGTESVIPQIKEIPPDTLVQFPEGTYLTDEQVDLPGLGNVGFEAIGDATIKGAPGFEETTWNVSDANAVYYQGFTHDQTDGAVGHYWQASDRIELHDIEVKGRAGPWAVELCPTITDPDGIARIVNYENHQGSTWAEYNDGSGGANGRIGCWLGENHVGTIQFIDCDFREYGNNALYCAAASGPVQVIDSYFENNNVASVRIGGKDSYVEDTTIVVDPDRYTGPRDEAHEDERFFMRGVLIHENLGGTEQKEAGASVRNCDLVIEENPTAAPAIEVWANGRSLEITGTKIEYNNTGISVIRREQYGTKAGVHPPGEDPRWLRLDDSVIVGSGSVDAVVDITDGDGSHIRNTQIELTGEGDGVRLRDSRDCVIESSNISVPGETTVIDNAEVDITQLTEDGLDEDDLDRAESERDDTEDVSLLSQTQESGQIHVSGGSNESKQDADSSDTIPGITHSVVGGLASLGAAGYVLKRRFGGSL